MSLKVAFVKAVENLDDEQAMALAEQLKQSGCSQMDIVDLLLAGIKLVGLRYEGGEYFIADLIMSGIIFRNILGLDRDPAAPPAKRAPQNPRVVVGTVEGDVHDIGKDIFIGMLEAKSVCTLDLGVDVTPECFVAAIEKHHPAIVVLSGTMTFVADVMKRTIDAITARGLRTQVKIVIGGSGVNQAVADELRVDAYSADLISGTALCERLIQLEVK